MAQPTDIMGMLDLLDRPGFCVKEHRILHGNHAARSLGILPETDVRELLETGKEEYETFTQGCLYLTMTLAGNSWGVSITRMEDFHLFLLEPSQEQPELVAMALAARELREPLSNIMITADRLFPMVEEGADPKVQEQMARMNRGLHQLLRLIGNMADAGRYTMGLGVRKGTVDITALIQEIFDRSAALVAQAGLALEYTGPRQPIFTLVAPEMLERAVMNILSNAMKFSPKGGKITARLTKTGRLLRLSILDNSEGLDEAVRGDLFTRYLRQPAIEDSRFGIGLGLVMVRAAAAQHGGTVLVDQPETGGLRVTMTLPIRENPDAMVCCSIYGMDYAGERDHGLIELSDTLPASAYEVNKIN